MLSGIAKHTAIPSRSKEVDRKGMRTKRTRVSAFLVRLHLQFLKSLVQLVDIDMGVF